MNDYIKRSDAYTAIHAQYPQLLDAGVHLVINAIPAADVVERPRWIPVTERLPIGGDDSGAICENVCLLLDGGTVSCGWMNGITKKVYYLNERDDFVIKAPITCVTHWMPLPEPPKEVDT